MKTTYHKKIKMLEQMGSIIMRRTPLTEASKESVIKNGADKYTKQYSDNNPSKTDNELSVFNTKVTRLLYVFDEMLGNDRELASELGVTSGIESVVGNKFRYKGHTGYLAFFAALHSIPMAKIRAVNKRLATAPPDDEENPGWDSIIPDEYVVYEQDGIVIIQGASKKIAQKISRYVGKDAYCIAYTSKHRENLYNKYKKMSRGGDTAKAMPYFIFNYNEPNTGGKFSNYHLSVLYKADVYTKNTQNPIHTRYAVTRGDNGEQTEDLSIDKVISLYNENWSNSNANFLRTLELSTDDKLDTTPEYVKTMREYYTDFVDKGTHYECNDVNLDGDSFFDWRAHLDKYGTDGYDVL